MSITHPTGRYGTMVGDSLWITNKDPAEARARIEKAMRGEYTQAEVEELETGDLTDIHTTLTLIAAYEAADPTERTVQLGPGRPDTNVSDAELRTRIAQSEQKIEQTPKDATIRRIRLDALAELARRRKHEAIGNDATSQRAATRRQQGLNAVPDCPGWEPVLNALSEAVELVLEPHAKRWEVTAIGETHGRLLIETKGGNAVTEGLELLAHITSGHTCQDCGGGPGESHAGLWPLRLCTTCMQAENRRFNRHHLERGPDGELTEAARTLRHRGLGYGAVRRFPTGK